jgi:hypothetical protein
MFVTFNTALVSVGTGMAELGGGVAVISVAVLALMNQWGILDPRMGQAVKAGLLRTILSGILLAGAGGAATVIASLSST